SRAGSGGIASPAPTGQRCGSLLAPPGGGVPPPLAGGSPSPAGVPRLVAGLPPLVGALLPLVGGPLLLAGGGLLPADRSSSRCVEVAWKKWRLCREDGCRATMPFFSRSISAASVSASDQPRTAATSWQPDRMTLRR